ncbi:hypothetical protein ELUMI_v1c07990 [Williamsoniiplasma luminosum]|uniref:Uncharacterized protein n=1 Tax=Williamsoniiplasma luminosum TaxID=214888 RepID=A0A2K8NXP6_9MOLU|nr:hypothetical protein ELUMI_v1c07990 [Williamsoniiplasma luminosum]
MDDMKETYEWVVANIDSWEKTILKDKNIMGAVKRLAKR